MTKNSDGSVTLKSTGKVASTPKSGSGKGVKAPLARSVSGGPKVVSKVGNRTVVPRRSGGK
jgi:hypothetical protein